MNIINVNLKPRENNSYPIYIGVNLFKDFVITLQKHYMGKQIVIVTDNNVAKLYLESFKQILEMAGYMVLPLIIRAGESSKTSAVKNKLEDAMFSCRINRASLLIAFGGGVVGDLAGYLASTYMRGIKYVQVPTNLLAMTDSSVGGKTAINNKYGKNLIGTYYQPLFVFIDISLLLSLTKRHLINGFIEVLKIFLTFDKNYVDYVASNLDKLFELNQEFLLKVIKKAVELKAFVVENDEKEENFRMALNFGHTIGHAIECVSNYRVLHGVAVGIGIIFESLIAVEIGVLSKSEASLIEGLLIKLNINRRLLNNYDINKIIDATLLDKKNSANGVKCILLKQIGTIAKSGHMFATDIDQSIIQKVLSDN